MSMDESVWIDVLARRSFSNLIELFRLYDHLLNLLIFFCVFQHLVDMILIQVQVCLIDLNLILSIFYHQLLVVTFILSIQKELDLVRYSFFSFFQISYYIS
jgi:hypothetical protein